MKKTVKEILSNVLVLELIGLGVILTITVIILTVCFSGNQAARRAGKSFGKRTYWGDEPVFYLIIV